MTALSVSNRLGIEHVVQITKLARDNGFWYAIVAVRPVTYEVVGEPRIPVGLNI